MDKQMATATTVTTDRKRKNPKSLTYQRDKERELVKGIFHFHEVPGGSMSFNFKKYKGDKVERYDLVDGQVYSIPLGVARHLNKNGSYPVHAHMQGEDGKPHVKVGQKVNRFSFQSLEFMDIDDLPNKADEIITVEHV